MQKYANVIDVNVIKQKQKQKRPADTLRTIITSPEYMERKAGLKRELGGRAVISAAAWEGMLYDSTQELAARIRQESRGRDTEEALMIELAGALPAWVRAQKELDGRREEMTRNERREALKPAVRVNHILRTIIDNEYFSTIEQAKGFIRTALFHFKFKPELINYASNMAGQMLNGMRHEIAAESVLNSLHDVVYDARPATDEEDRKGIDVVVELADGSSVEFDIKASRRGEQEAHLRRSPGNTTLPIWSGFSNREFGDYLLLSNEELETRKGYYLACIDRARKLKQPQETNIA